VQAVKANGGKSGGSGIFRGLEGSSGDPIASHSSGRHLSNKVKCSSRSADRKSASKVKDRRGKCQWKRGDNSGFWGAGKPQVAKQIEIAARKNINRTSSFPISLPLQSPHQYTQLFLNFNQLNTEKKIVHIRKAHL